MPHQQSVARKATIKRARAEFKSRGQPTISNSERKQILRQVELDRRAWGIEQREKKRAEAALKKKEERERREKEDCAKVQMGTQMRCDRFGYKSSQFHLGKFFGAAKKKEQDEEISVATVEVEEEDMFGDDGVDDDTLLEALGLPDSRPHADLAPESLLSVHELPPQVTLPAKTPSCDDDMLDFWDELGSSTQIARELADEGPRLKQPQTCQPIPPCSEVFTERRNPTMDAVPACRSNSHRSSRDLMAPPPLPLKVMRPNIPTRGLQTLRKPPFKAPSTIVATSGFTMSELEDFVDDDLQLTQVAPG